MKTRTIWMVILLLIPWLMATATENRSLGRIPPGEKRVALVIGNNDYAHVEKLRNAVADAEAMKRELTALGFDVVYRKNANRDDMNEAIDEFLGKLSSDAIGLMFYAGHGVEIKGASYVIPTDMKAKKETQIVNNGIEIARVLEQMGETHAKFSLVILDACRDNPFKGTGSRSIGGSRGLATPSSASGIMVVYSAGANQRALDRLNDEDKDPNGLFTREFLKAIKEPGVNVKAAVENVKQTVIAQAKTVGHQQTPAIYDQSTGSFFFTLPSEHKATVTVEPSGGGQSDRETVFWQSAQVDPVMCQEYLTKYPKGEYTRLAQRCVEKGKESKPMVRHTGEGGQPSGQPSVEKRSLSSKKIMVVMPEHHLRRYILDPAGETEMIRILIKNGFFVIDQKQSQTMRQNETIRAIFDGDVTLARKIGSRFDADILIIGESIAETTGDIHGFISARARVEARVIIAKTGEIIATDGKHASGADLSEALAGKTAIRKASADLANELIHNLDFR